MYYAQIDTNNIVFAVTQTTSPINKLDMIEVDSYDETFLGKKFNSETGSFEEVLNE